LREEGGSLIREGALAGGFVEGGCAISAFPNDRAANAVVTASADCTTLRSMDEEAIRLAAMVTVLRTIENRFPAGRKRTAWLRWFSQAASMTERESAHGRLIIEQRAVRVFPAADR
jgi:hypothetical protein